MMLPHKLPVVDAQAIPQVGLGASLGEYRNPTKPQKAEVKAFFEHRRRITPLVPRG